MTFKEIWKPVKGFPFYEVSNLGRVRSIDRKVINGNGCKIPRKGKVLKQAGNGNGYLRATVYLDGKPKYHSIHRMVALAFIPNPENKYAVNHKDCNKENNNVNNLEWVTKSENEIHARKMGVKDTRGENQSNVKLTEIQVLKIRELEGEVKHKILAERFSVSLSTIRNILYRKTWKHI